MPPPGNATDFLTVVERSGLLKEVDLDGYRFRSTADPSPPDRVAKWMLMDGRLTQFQAGLLLAGKSHPFFVGPYKILSRIGNGSMGVVYLCEHHYMARKVAVKILQKRRTEDAIALERFLREARASAALNHPNVVHALDFGRENHVHYMVMEYIDGRSLKAMVLEDGALPPLKVAQYLRQAALGLQHAHEAGLIHRDIKPSNIMISRAGVVKLLDLGLAQVEESEVDLTQGKPLGTMAYVPPEQVLDSHDVDARADIYSLGATFYLALTGRAPKAGIGIGDSIPPELEDVENFGRLMVILRRMTARSPGDRFQNAAEVAAQMDQLLTPQVPAPRTESETIPTDELNTVESLGSSTNCESENTPVPEAKNVNDRESSVAQAETVESVEPTVIEETAAPTPTLEGNAETLPTSDESSSRPAKNSTKRRMRARSGRTTAIRWQERSRLACQWLIRRWQPLVLAIAAVVGLVAALATRG
jgi:serine/threonine protein kinase